MTTIYQNESIPETPAGTDVGGEYVTDERGWMHTSLGILANAGRNLKIDIVKELESIEAKMKEALKKL